ncbi:MAG: class I SAM-dependent methyltransferase [Candidatus Eremiobacteraeota bacterium]|nr:class I SAM-dependent methyltransferase [Candidatus Eremiobacteraeota bacterium]MCW5871460.1 class I SAM-dependent methyltransferase [Candidatus Eremiobacteraeota bacterium]
MAFDLEQAYLDLVQTAIGGGLCNPPDLPFSKQELLRARALTRRVRSIFAPEVRALKKNQLALSEPALTTLRGLLLDFQAEDVARLLRINSPVGHTLLGQEALTSLRNCARQAIWLRVPGDFMECGTWRGGACILLRAIQNALGVGSRRRTWVADSFQGLPQPDQLVDAVLHAYLKETGSFSVSLEEVRQNFARYGLLDEGVCFLPGWFADTLPSWQGQLALLRLDGDWYESTYTALEHLYDKVSWGGFIIIDDYNPVIGAYAAVNDFRAARSITDPLVQVDHQIHFWRKLPPHI